MKFWNKNQVEKNEQKRLLNFFKNHRKRGKISLCSEKKNGENPRRGRIYLHFVAWKVVLTQSYLFKSWGIFSLCVTLWRRLLKNAEQMHTFFARACFSSRCFWVSEWKRFWHFFFKTESNDTYLSTTTPYRHPRSWAQTKTHRHISIYCVLSLLCVWVCVAGQGGVQLRG